MNDVLAGLMNDIAADLARIWPLFGLVNRMASRTDDGVADLGMRAARGEAWGFAIELAALDESARAAKLTAVDKRVAELGRLIGKPLFPINALQTLARLGELESVPRVIEILVNRRR
jgi:hypothetical protein